MEKRDYSDSRKPEASEKSDNKGNKSIVDELYGIAANVSLSVAEIRSERLQKQIQPKPKP